MGILRNWLHGRCWLLALTLALSLSVANAAHATTWAVANNGVDSGVCGTLPNPACRSVGQAIANASPGDTVLVGPGLYGDLNYDGTLGTSPGEETVGASGVLQIDKQLTILSRDGAGSTVIDGAGVNWNLAYIGANGVVFGKPLKGFTLRNGLSTGIVIYGSNVSLRGNLLDNVGTAAFLVQNITPLSQPVSGVVIANNVVQDDTPGGGGGGSFAVLDYAIGTVVKANMVRGTSHGMYFTGNGAVVSHNILTANGASVTIVLPPLTANSVASFSRNSVIGNRFGVQVFMADSVSSHTTNRSITLSGNNYFGNGSYSVDAGTYGDNCGIYAQSNGTTYQLTVTSNGDYWGGAGGPGADPKDDAGTANPNCTWGEIGPIAINIESPSSSEIKVKSPLKIK